jgi:hypothetical protein
MTIPAWLVPILRAAARFLLRVAADRVAEKQAAEAQRRKLTNLDIL